MPDDGAVASAFGFNFLHYGLFGPVSVAIGSYVDAFIFAGITCMIAPQWWLIGRGAREATVAL